MPPHRADLYEQDDAEDAPADSGHLRVSRDTAYESGIPPAHEKAARDGDTLQKCLEQLELALVETMRAECNVGLLLRGLTQLFAAANSAREANAALLAELVELRGTLAATEHERQQWIEQEDAFLIELMTDYEERLGETLAQRDAARAELRQISYERDTALKLLSEPATMPEPAQKASPFEIGYLKLRKTPLKQKPEASTRPLIGYSMSGESLSEERVVGPRSVPPSQKK